MIIINSLKELVNRLGLRFLATPLFPDEDSEVVLSTLHKLTSWHHTAVSIARPPIPEAQAMQVKSPKFPPTKTPSDTPPPVITSEELKLACRKHAPNNEHDLNTWFGIELFISKVLQDLGIQVLEEGKLP